MKDAEACWLVPKSGYGALPMLSASLVESTTQLR